jgi:COX assembly protein 2
MHPPLFRPHPICSELVNKLVQCHKDNEIGKFFGACNEIKSEMDQCFRMEKEEKRLANLVLLLYILSTRLLV